MDTADEIAQNSPMETRNDDECMDDTNREHKDRDSEVEQPYFEEDNDEKNREGSSKSTSGTPPRERRSKRVASTDVGKSSKKKKGDSDENGDLDEDGKRGSRSKPSAALNNAKSESVIHVGNKYQAACFDDDIMDEEKRTAEQLEEDKDTLLWCAPQNVDEALLNDYIEETVGIYSFSMDRALFILLSCDFNFELAKAKVRSRRIVVDEWTDDDDALFKQAFQIFGKNFTKIRSIMPYRPVSSIVNHYYEIKKHWKHKSHIQEASMKDDKDEEEHENAIYFGSRNGACSNVQILEESLRFRERIGLLEEGQCENCGHHVKTLKPISTLKKRVCYACFIYYENNNCMRPSNFVCAVRDENYRKAYKCPAGMEEIAEQFALMSSTADKSGKQNGSGFNVVGGSKSNGRVLLEQMEKDIKRTKAQCLRLENSLDQKIQVLPDLSQYKATVKNAFTKKERVRYAHTWSEEEKFAAFHCLIRYNLEFDIVAEVVETKSSDMVKSFYLENKERIDKHLNEVQQKLTDDLSKFNLDTMDTKTEEIVIDLD